MNELDVAKKILAKVGKNCIEEPLTIAADGSTRRFWRLADSIIVAPPVEFIIQDIYEARAGWHIGTHLYDKGCATPQIFGFDKESGIFVMEDVGSTSLYDCVFSASNTKKLELYKKVIERLVFMQVQGRENFNPEWCYNAGKYNATMMVEKESNYFISAWWQGIIKRDIPDGIKEEFETLAKNAAEAPANFFQHRDCQSRNIMIKEGLPYFIDFQGGLLGALGYDLASLLIDPYVDLPSSLQDELLHFYIYELGKITNIKDHAQFIYWYNLLAVQRNLQIIGAFSFLSVVKNKSFFAQYVKPSVVMLNNRLTHKQFDNFPILKETIKTGLTIS